MAERNDNHPPAAELNPAATDDSSGNARNGAKKRRDPNEPSAVVGLGASAGGISVLQQFFGDMPPESGIAFVVVMHLSPDFESQLANVLQQKTSMPVVQVSVPVRVRPNHVYVIPPNHQLTFEESTLHLREPQHTQGRRVTIDLFFRTLAQAYGQRSVCVVLSGTDSDGVIGLKHIRAQGGVTIAQDPEEAEFESMPLSAIQTGMVDWVLKVSEMPGRLIDLVKNESAMELPPEIPDATEPDVKVADAPGGETISDETRDPDDESAIEEVLKHVRVQTGHDFSHYKRATILRRIARRLQVNSLESIPRYLDFMRKHGSEARALLHDLLIGVTHFFRDQTAFAALEANLPQLVAGKGSNDQLRVWVPGCATGEEAYSIAIMLAEQAMHTNRPPTMQIFATDLDDDSIRTAREGIYPATIEADVSQDRLRQFFFNHQGRYRIRKEVREMVLFAEHDLLRDSPFSRLDLVSCRNLLIYLKPEAQHRVMDIFHFALRPGGLLLLGGSEHMDDNHALFQAIDSRHRLYVRRSTARLPIVNLYARPPKLRVQPPNPMSPRLATPMVEAEFTPGEGEEGAITLTERRGRSLADLHGALLEQYGPPSLVVDSNHDILHMSGKAGEFLHFGAGEPSANLLKLVDETLQVELRTALFRAGQEDRNVSVPRVRTVRDGELRFVDLHVRPAQTEQSPEKIFLIIFDEKPATTAEQAQPGPIAEGGDNVAKHLEREVKHLRQQLAITIEQAEGSQEELKASNEELQAMNEEMRSATEELETGKEELQSVNEELTTVNHELKSNVEELSRTNSDLQNLMAATDIATVFLDRNLRIKRFTPRLQELFNVIAADIGRPLADIRGKLNYPELGTDAERVLKTLEKHSREVQADGHWLIARIGPYRALDEKIDGVVITFVDITERKHAEESLRNSEEQFRRAIEDAPIPVIVHAEDGQVLQISRIWTELTGYTPEDMPTFDAWLNTACGQGANAVREHMQDLFKGSRKVLNLDFPVRTKAGEVRYWTFSASAPGSLADGRRFIVGMAVDITERKHAEESTQAAEQRLQRVLETDAVGVLFFDQNGTVIHANEPFLKMTGHSREAVETGQLTWRGMTPPEFMEVTEEQMEKLRATGKIGPYEKQYFLADGSRRWMLFTGRDLGDGMMAEYVLDITDRKNAEAALSESEERFRQFAENSADVFWIVDAENETLEYLNPVFDQMFGEPREVLLRNLNRYYELIHPEDSHIAGTAMRKALTGERSVVEYRIIRPSDGQVRWIRDTGFPIPGENGGIARVAGVAQDVTADKEHTQKSERAEERFRLLVEGTPDYAMFLLDPNNKITFWSSGAEKVFGWNAQEATGKSGNIIFTPEDNAKREAEKELAIAREHGSAPDQRWHQRKDGSRLWADGVMRRIGGPDGGIRGFAKICRDASEQKEQDEALRHARDQLEQRVLERTADLMATNNELERTMAQREELERELLEISERERRRIGQDLHDVVCQELTATALFLKSAGNKIQNEEAARSLSEAAQIVNRNVAIARDLARGFQPPVLGAGGLPAALRSLCKEGNERPGMECTLKLPRAVRVRDETTALNLFRIAQEAMRNALSHSGGNKIALCIERERDLIRMVVEDNGKGFRPRKSGKGLGLHIMKYRANVLGGTLSIISRPKGGTRMVCEVPVKK